MFVLLHKEEASKNPWTGAEVKGSYRLLDVAAQPFDVAHPFDWFDCGDKSPDIATHYFRDEAIVAHQQPSAETDSPDIPTTEL